MREAVCCLVVRNGKVLGVSSKRNPNHWGLPGGKVEPRENQRDAAVRELREETGLLSYGMVQLMEAPCYPTEPGGETFVTRAYLAFVRDGQVIRPEKGTLAQFMAPGELTACSPYAVYMRDLWRVVGAVMPALFGGAK